MSNPVQSSNGAAINSLGQTKCRPMYPEANYEALKERKPLGAFPPAFALTGLNGFYIVS